MKSTLKFSLFTALLSLGLAGCSKQEAPTPTVPSAAATTANANGESILRAGERLTAGQFLQSYGGQYRLVMQGDGNLVIYRLADFSARWSSRTAGNPGAFCTMQSDGNFVVYAANGRPLFTGGAQDRPNVRYFAYLVDNGILYTAVNGAAIKAISR
ncbi:hypothetical protein IC235_19920 [Hymenobacter sp. BT664]|uniref:Bulb-type lectin domain-containing protein n=1 Tax=Hymenobacter montanus TaxID=2771359 RepID=A0A927BGR7_9BACT|nr:hypothetical protein [Hymenobacter montanus]MBD2770161.1 hypothetical protein [Hymenobacter montanus]